MILVIFKEGIFWSIKSKLRTRRKVDEKNYCHDAGC